MRLRIFSLVVASVLAVSGLAASSAKADIVSITQQTLSQCGQGSIVCDGTSAFSLTAIEDGSVQLLISNSQTPSFVVVNDTGSTITDLTFDYFGVLASNANLNCQINGPAQSEFSSCTVTGVGSSGSGTTTLNGPITPPAVFNFIAGSGTGIAAGADFDITTASFAHAGQDNGCLTGAAAGSCTPTTPPVVPEPSSLALFATGLCCVAGILRHRLTA
jgi:PEP-CTERM motif